MVEASLVAQLRTIDLELQAGKLESAVRVIEDCLRQWPDEPQILQREAMCRYRLGEKALALTLQRELVARLPENAEAANRLIAWSIETGDFVSIRPLLNAWRERAPDNPRFWLSEISALHLAGQQAARLIELRRFVQHHPAIEAGWTGLVWAEQKSGGGDLLDIAIRGALLALPDSLGIARAAVEASLAAQNLELAILARESLLRIAPQFDAHEPRLLCRTELLRVVRCYHEGVDDKALEEIRALVKRFPDEAGPARQYSGWLSERARHAEALALVEEWRKRLPGDADFALREVRVLRTMGMAMRAWELSDELVKNHPSLEVVWVEKLLLTGDRLLGHLWHDTAVRATALFPASFRIVQALYAAAIQDGELDFMSEIFRKFFENCQESLAGYRLAADFYSQQLEHAETIKLTDAGLSKFPDDYVLLLLRLQAARALGRNEVSWVSWAKTLLQHAKINDRGMKVAGKILRETGNGLLLSQLLLDITHSDTLSEVVRGGADKILLSLSQDTDNSLATRGIAEYEGAVVSNFPPNVYHVVLVFRGVAGGSPLEQLLQPIFDKLGVGSVLMHDCQRIGFLNGIEELAEDYDSTLIALRKLLPDTVTKITCLGNSAGGYAALRYAIDLKATSALMFAAPTNFEEEAMARDGRGKVLMRRINQIVPHRALNLAQVLAHAEYKPNVHLWYGGAMQQDREHALNMSGLPRVTLHELSGYEGHDVLIHLASTGLLEDAVRRALIAPEHAM